MFSFRIQYIGLFYIDMAAGCILGLTIRNFILPNAARQYFHTRNQAQSDTCLFIHPDYCNCSVFRKVGKSSSLRGPILKVHQRHCFVHCSGTFTGESCNSLDIKLDTSRTSFPGFPPFVVKSKFECIGGITDVT